MKEEKVDKEFSRLREWIWSVKGRECAHCKGKATELHHIIPRRMGGDNRLSNIVPLCHECHLKAHGKKATKKEVAHSGRKPMPLPSNFEKVANDYIKGKCSLETALKDVQMGKDRFYKYLYKYIEEHDKATEFKERKRGRYCRVEV